MQSHAGNTSTTSPADTTQNQFQRTVSATDNSFQRNQKHNTSGIAQAVNTNNINVIVRIKPMTNTYQQNTANYSIMSGVSGATAPFIAKCIQEIKDKKTIVIPQGKATEMFTFDYVGDEDCQQDEIFKVSAKPIVDQCLLGYNGTIFAYGQTGSGKTHTILGDKRSYETQNDDSIMNVDQMNSSHSFTNQSSQGSHYQNIISALDKSQAGILPRAFDYMFQKIQRVKNMFSQKSDRSRRSARKSFAPSHANLPTFNENCVRVEFDIKCQFIEIYNENVYDLLDTSIDQKLNIRQDNDKGIYVEGGKQEVVNNLQDVMKLVARGNLNRSIASTNMNRESSRSHAVFITHIKTIEILENGKQNAKISRFYIVDLAGSERCKDTGAEGIRLKEASNINKSLSVLGNVINKLSENSRSAETKPKTHINYRDSKLTFLLQDSLGGNAKTVIICNVNPHVLAMKETRNTLQFAQRAKMIQNQAIINEDTNCVEFWKTKCQILERQITKNGSSMLLSRGNTLSKFNDQSMNEGDFVCHKCQGGMDTKRGCNNQDQKDYEKLNIDALRTIKEYSLQLKEIRDQANINSIDVKKSIDSALQYKNSVKLQTELALNKSNKMRIEFEKLINLRKAQDPNSEIYNQELMAQIDGMKILIDSQQQEIDQLKHQLENNPLLALKSCQVNDLEKRLKQYQENDQMNMEKDSNSIERKINDILDDVNRLIAKSENLYNSKKIDRMNQDVAGNFDIEMIDTTRSNNNQQINQTTNNIQLSQMGGGCLDLTVLHQRRDQELANIKLQYEEQLETMRSQLKKEQENVRRLKSFLTQTNAVGSQYTFGDEMLQNSQISSILHINRGQTQLMESQRLIYSQQLQTGPNNTENPFMQTMHLPTTQSNQLNNLLQNNNNNQDTQDIIQEQIDEENSQQQQHQLIDVGEFEKLLNDCQQEINQLTQDNTNLLQQNQQLHQMIDEQTQSLQELTLKYDEAVSVRIALETDKLQIQSKVDELQAQLEQLESDNDEMFKVKVELERLENENQELKDNIKTLNDDLTTANEVNEYYSNNVIPTFNKEIAIISEQFQVLKLENQQLKELKSNDPEKDQLQSQINTLQQDLKQKDQDLQRMHEALDKSLSSIDEQKEYIQNLNLKYQEQLNEYTVMKKEHESVTNQNKEMIELIDESQNALIESEKKMAKLQKQNQELTSKYNLEMEKYKSMLSDKMSRLLEQEHANKILINDLQNSRNEIQMLLQKINDLNKELTEFRAKYVTYKSMATKQMEQMQLTVDTVTKYRQSLGTKTENSEQLIQKYRGEIEQLKDYLRKKEQEMQGMAKKLQTLEEFRMKLIEKDKELKRVHDLEKETSNLRTELKIYETRCQQIEANYLMKENEHKKLQEQFDQLEKEFLDLSKLGDQAKYQHINKVRGQNNQYVKDLNTLNQEMKNLKIESKGMISLIVKFTSEVFHKLRLDNWGGKTKSPIRANPETHLKEYLNDLLDIIGQGFTNLHLQLETPQNVTAIKLPGGYEQDSNSVSEESSNGHQQQMINEHYQQVMKQQQQQYHGMSSNNTHNGNAYGNRQGSNQQQQQFRQQQQQIQQQSNLQNKNINLQVLNQQAQQQQQQQQRRPMPVVKGNNDQHNSSFNSQLDRSMEMKENNQQNMNRVGGGQNVFNSMSNQKPTDRFGQQQQTQQQQLQGATYQVHVPIQSNKFAQQQPNTQLQPHNRPQNGVGQQSTNQLNKQQINRSGFAVPPSTQQQQQQQQLQQHQQRFTAQNNNNNSNGQQPQVQQHQNGRQPSNNNRDPSSTRMDIC